MKTYVSIKRPIQLLLLLVSVASIVTFFIFPLSNDRKQIGGEDGPVSESGRSEDVVLGLTSAQKKVPAPLISAFSSLHDPSLSKVDETNVQDNANLEGEALAMSSQQPTEQQLEYQTLLEQKVNGDIQVFEPLLPAVLKSQEFAALTKRQQNAIAQRIIDRLNRGELSPQDVYP